SYLSAGWVYAREHRGKAERKPRPAQERKIGQAAKRRSRSASVSGDDEDVSEPGTPAPARATKRAKKARTERAPETPTRRMASRVVKAKATAYRDIDSSEGEEDEEDEILESDEDN
ncbi:hypothetical protein CPC16_011331, partial [Podila verticillata]